MLEKLKETGIYLIGMMGVSIMSFVISLIYSRIFPIEDYGYYSLIAALYNLFFQLFTGWMTHSILRFYPEEQKNNNSKNLKMTMFFVHLLGSIVFALIMLITSLYYKNNNFMIEMIITYTIVFIFEGLVLIFNTFIRAEGNSKQYSTNTVLNSVLKSVTLLLLYFVINIKSIVIIVVSILITELIQSIYMFIKFEWYKIISVRNIRLTVLRKTVQYGYPLIFVSIIFCVLTYSDRYIIQIFGSTSDVGLYSYGYNMGNALFYSMANAIMLGAYPTIVEEWEKKGRESTERVITNYLNIYCYLMLPALIGVIAIGSKIVHCLFGQNYWDSDITFIVTCISYTVYGFLQYTNKAWELAGKTKIILLLNVLAAGINLILNIVLVPKYGYIAAAWTTLLSFVVYIIVSLYLSRNILKFRFERSVIFRVLFALIVMFITTKLLDILLPQKLIVIVFEIVMAVIVYSMVLLILKDKYIWQIIDGITYKHR